MTMPIRGMAGWATVAAAVADHPGGVLLPPTPAAVPAAALRRHPFRAKLPQLPGSMA